MRGDNIVGYGRYNYVYDSGRDGTFLATGFSRREARMSIYIMPGYQGYGAILAKLGKYKPGAACLYVNRLSDIDLRVLRQLIQTGQRDLNRKWAVHPV